MTRRSISRRIAGSRAPAGLVTITAPGSSCLAVLPSGETLGLAHQTIWSRPPKGVRRQTRESAVWAETVAAIGRPATGSRFISVADRGADVFEHLEGVRDTGWDAVVRAAPDRRLATGGGSLTTLRAAGAMGAATVLTRQGEGVVCVAWRALELLPPRNGPAGRAPIRVWGVRVWNDTLEWLLLTTRPVETLDQALEIIAWYSRRWTVEVFHKAWKTGCRAEQRQLEEADRLVPLLGALAIVAVRLLGLRDAARRDGGAPCRRRRSGSSPPSFSSQQTASPPTATSCAAAPVWAAFSPANPTANLAGRRSGRDGSSS